MIQATALGRPGTLAVRLVAHLEPRPVPEPVTTHPLKLGTWPVLEILLKPKAATKFLVVIFCCYYCPTEIWLSSRYLTLVIVWELDIRQVSVYILPKIKEQRDNQLNGLPLIGFLSAMCQINILVSFSLSFSFPQVCGQLGQIGLTLHVPQPVEVDITLGPESARKQMIKLRTCLRDVTGNQ